MPRGTSSPRARRCVTQPGAPRPWFAHSHAGFTRNLLAAAKANVGCIWALSKRNSEKQVSSVPPFSVASRTVWSLGYIRACVRSYALCGDFRSDFIQAGHWYKSPLSGPSSVIPTALIYHVKGVIEKRRSHVITFSAFIKNSTHYHEYLL